MSVYRRCTCTFRALKTRRREQLLRSDSIMAVVDGQPTGAAAIEDSVATPGVRMDSLHISVNVSQYYLSE